MFHKYEHRHRQYYTGIESLWSLKKFNPWNQEMGKLIKTFCKMLSLIKMHKLILMLNAVVSICDGFKVLYLVFYRSKNIYPESLDFMVNKHKIFILLIRHICSHTHTHIHSKTWFRLNNSWFLLSHIKQP